MKSVNHSITFVTEETEDKDGAIATFSAHRTGLFIDASNIFDGVKTTNRLKLCPRDAKLLLDYLNRSFGE